jgi:hypothetical protein
MAKKRNKPKGQKRWIQELETRDVVEESEGTFSGDNSAEEIAVELKRKAPDFQAAVGKVTLYLNRAGKRLSESRRKELKRVPVILRELYDRKDRQRANKDQPIKVDLKTSSLKVAMFWGTWKDDQGQMHHGDQFTELLLADEDQVESVHPEISWDNLEDWRDFIIEFYFGKKYFTSKNDKAREMLLKQAISKMHADYKKEDAPVLFWDITKDPREERFEVVDKRMVASTTAVMNDGTKEMIFASSEDAINHLSCMIAREVKIAPNEE